MLDMCAAPGGKSLLLAQLLHADCAQEAERCHGAHVRGEARTEVAGQRNDNSSAVHATDGQSRFVDNASCIGAATHDGGCQHESCKHNGGAQPSAASAEPHAAVHMRTAASFGSGGCNSCDDSSAAEHTSSVGGTLAHVSPEQHGVLLRQRSHLTCNEVDCKRRERLAAVLRSYVPAHVRQHVDVRCFVAATVEYFSWLQTYTLQSRWQRGLLHRESASALQQSLVARSNACCLH